MTKNFDPDTIEISLQNRFKFQNSHPTLEPVAVDYSNSRIVTKLVKVLDKTIRRFNHR